MQQLIQQLTEQYNLSEEEATGIIDTVKNYVPANNADENSSKEIEKQVVVITATPIVEEEEGMFEKSGHFVINHIPGGLIEKAEELFSGVGDNAKSLFS